MSYRISISPIRREAGRFIGRVRHALLVALAEESKKRGLTQAEIARKIGVNRSVINKELRGEKDITLGRVAELAAALGRKPVFELREPQISAKDRFVKITTDSTNRAVPLPKSSGATTHNSSRVA